MEDESVRIFFAITLDDTIKNLIINYIEELKKSCPLPIRWVKDFQLHLTLRFIGNIPSSQLETIYKNLSKFEELPSFNLQLQQLIAFPIQKPRVIGVGIQLSKELNDLVQLLDNQLTLIGIPSEERSFLPHITIGRIIHPRRGPLSLENYDLATEQVVNHISLFKSDLTPEGSHYTVLKDFKLS